MALEGGVGLRPVVLGPRSVGEHHGVDRLVRRWIRNELERVGRAERKANDADAAADLAPIPNHALGPRPNHSERLGEPLVVPPGLVLGGLHRVDHDPAEHVGRDHDEPLGGQPVRHVEDRLI